MAHKLKGFTQAVRLRKRNAAANLEAFMKARTVIVEGILSVSRCHTRAFAPGLTASDAQNARELSKWHESLVQSQALDAHSVRSERVAEYVPHVCVACLLDLAPLALPGCNDGWWRTDGTAATSTTSSAGV